MKERMMELYKKQRPKNLKQFLGNKNTVNSLQSKIDNDSLPHAILFTGPTGCGKTTLGRIIANTLECKGLDYKEIDSGVFRGIDTVRDLRKEILYKPIESPFKVIVIDECFVKNTKIKTINGLKNIQDIKIGEKIYSLNGTDIVKNTFKNKVPLNRVIKLQFSNNQTIYTTKEHKFFTENGWVYANDLNKNNLIYTFNSYIMDNINKEYIRGLNENLQMQIMPKRDGKLRITGLEKKKKSVLFKGMSTKSDESFSKKQSAIMEENAYKRSEEKSRYFYKQSAQKLFSRIKRKISERIFGTYEKKQSDARPKKYPKRYQYKKIKWYSGYIKIQSWWKWKINTTTNIIGNFFRLGNGIAYSFSPSFTCWEEKKVYNGKQITNKLQNRYRERNFKDSNRSGWEWAQIEKKYNERSKKNESTPPIRLESSEVYKRGDNEQSFRGIITDKERNQNYIIMYDIEVTKHPSYFVADIPVHNCHQLGVGGSSMKNPAQNALLKILEDTPEHAYIILCTTDPQMLIPPIKGRCAQYNLEPLSEDDCRKLIKRAAKKEKKKIPEEVVQQIYLNSQGLPRNALQILERIIDLNEKDMLDACNEEAEKQNAVIELSRALLKGSNWKQISDILKGLKNEDPEGIRRQILGYMQSVILNGKNNNAYTIMDWFEEPLYNIGFPGVVLNCYRVINGTE